MLPRRTLLIVAAAASLPLVGRAEAEPIVLGSLTPLTGAGGSYGPAMRDVIAAVIKQVNDAGGVLGRQVRLVSEDDQTNPDAGVRAARKLIDVDKVSAIIGTWASSVTTAVAPLCWESKTFLATVSGADSITQLPHQGYLVRTQPNTVLQSVAFVRLAQKIGAKRPYFLGPQTPFAEPTVRRMNELFKPNGITMGATIYDPQKTSYRSEVDAAMRTNPDTIFAGGYQTDTAVLLRDLYRAGFKGAIMAFGYAVNDKFIADQPKEITEGVYTLSPSPALDSPAFQAVQSILGRREVDPYSAQVYDQTSLILLAMQLGGGSTGTIVKDNIRRVSQGNGPKVSSAVEGLKALKDGAKALDYDGASGPCTFDEKGDISEVKFRYDRVQGGKLVLQSVG
ncbi:MAG: ABC transporter substrate-binding protein [Acetobacteraceae bacterium]|nr:ABC transporter substrate-binding protein [Acetobacteraceae bacterium]